MARERKTGPTEVEQLFWLRLQPGAYSEKKRVSAAAARRVSLVPSLGFSGTLLLQPQAFFLCCLKKRPWLQPGLRSTSKTRPQRVHEKLASSNSRTHGKRLWLQPQPFYHRHKDVKISNNAPAYSHRHCLPII